MINRAWLSELSSEIESSFGKSKRDELLGNFQNLGHDVAEIRLWFQGFTERLGRPENREVAKKALENSCPCRCPQIEESIRPSIFRSHRNQNEQQ